MKKGVTAYIILTLATLANQANAQTQLEQAEYCNKVFNGPKLQLEQIEAAATSAAYGEKDASVACGLWKQALDARQKQTEYEKQCSSPAAPITSAAMMRSYAKQIERACNSAASSQSSPVPASNEDAMAFEATQILNACNRTGLDFKETRLEGDHVFVIDYGDDYIILKIPMASVTVDSGNGYIGFQCVQYGCIQELGTPDPFNYNRRTLQRRSKADFSSCEYPENNNAGELLDKLTKALQGVGNAQ